MKFFKSILFLLGIAFLTSCGDDDCEPPTLAENIVGTWEVVISNEDVEFRADGTLIDPNDAIIGGEINGTVLNEKSYTVSGTTVNVRAASGSQFVDADLEMSNIECDEMTASVFGIPVQLKRK